MAIDTVTATGKVTAKEMDTATVMPVDMAKAMAVNIATAMSLDMVKGRQLIWQPWTVLMFWNLL